MATHYRMLFAALVLLPLAGGCGSRFSGEWVQESEVDGDGTLSPITGSRRMALRFDPPTTVRLGMYSDAARVVEAGTVSLNEYETLQNRSVAQFGAYTARVQDGQLVTYIGGQESGRFRRVEGRSVFPSRIQLPHLSNANAPATNVEAVPGAPTPTTPIFAAVEESSGGALSRGETASRTTGVSRSSSCPRRLWHLKPKLSQETLTRHAI